MVRSLLEHEAKRLLRDNDIPVLDFVFCVSPQEAVEAANKMGFPVVLKVVSSQVVHKSDAGGVKLNLKSDTEVEKAFSEIKEAVLQYDPQAEIEGVLVSPFVETGTELIVGAINDSQFGPVIMVGLGGIFVEIFKDVSFGIAPVDREEAAEMLKSLKAYSILEGARGQEGIDLEALVQLIVKTSELVYEQSIEELDLNPVFCYSDKVLAGDARILLNE